MDPHNELIDAERDVLALRTVMQHNLNLDERDDYAKLLRCEKWVCKALRREFVERERFWPSTSDDWVWLRSALESLGLRFFEIHSSVLMRITKDEFLDDVIDAWELRCTRALPAYEFDAVCVEAAAAMGLKHLV